MHDNSILSLIWHASIPVQLVMLILLLASIFSWALIYAKYCYIRQSRRAAKVFEDRFWSGINLNDLFAQLHKDTRDHCGLETLFKSGFREFTRAQKVGLDNTLTIRATHRAMKISMSKEIDTLEMDLSFLATVGSVSPYVGLFGTVWGIMVSFRALSGVQQATLSMVAPGISEALIATAMGLLAAIPAVVAYNKFTSDIDVIIVRYDNFLEAFIGVLQRQIQSPQPVVE